MRIIDVFSSWRSNNCARYAAASDLECYAFVLAVIFFLYSISIWQLLPSYQTLKKWVVLFTALGILDLVEKEGNCVWWIYYIISIYVCLLDFTGYD